jgi:hypothetical protein
MHNLAAIVWLYRGQRERFLGLVRDYLGRVCAEGEAVPAALATFEITFNDLRGRVERLAEALSTHTGLEAEKTQPLADAVRSRLVARAGAGGRGRGGVPPPVAGGRPRGALCRKGARRGLLAGV